MSKEIQEYLKEFHEGTTRIKRLSQEEECGRIEGGKRLLEATYIAGKGDGTNSANQRTNPISKDEQINRLLAYAKSEDLLFKPSYSDKVGLYLDNGAEQFVYMRDGDPYVTKFNNLNFHETPLEFFDRLAMHNYLFPEARYSLIGFSEFYAQNSCFSVVVTQPYVIATRGANREEVIIEMEKMGFTHEGGDTYLSPDYIVEDLHPGNALLTPQGNIAIIDPVIYLNTAEEDFGGTREIGG